MVASDEHGRNATLREVRRRRPLILDCERAGGKTNQNAVDAVAIPSAPDRLNNPMPVITCWSTR